jgi:hypothetical protein
MPRNQFQQLQEYQKKIAELQAQVARQSRKLLALPGRVGLRTVDELIRALQTVRSGGASGAAASAGRGGAGKPRRRRSKITPEMKQQLKTMVGQGKTGAQIAESLGISLPSVANIKRELGLSKRRKR